MATNSPTTTIGFIGAGTLSKRMLKSVLADQKAGKGDLRFILPVDEDLFTEEVETIAEWALDNDVPVEVVYEGDPPKSAKDVVADATTSHKVADARAKIVALLEKAPNGNLFVLYDDDDEVGYDAFVAADDAGVPTYDLCAGLERMTFGEEEPEEDKPTDEGPADKAEHVYTLDELLAMDIEDIKKIADARSIELPPRTRVKTYASTIFEAQEGGAKPEDEDVSDSPAATDPEVAQGSPSEAQPDAEDGEEEFSDEADVEPDTVIIKGKPSTASTATTTNYTTSFATVEASKGAAKNPYSGGSPFSVVSHCAGCGGPIMVDESRKDSTGLPIVGWSHAPKCMLV